MKTVALTAPDEALAILEELEIVADVDPVWVFLMHDGVCGAGGGIGNEEVEAVLNAVKFLDCYGMAVGEPDEARKEIVAGLAEVHPVRFAAGGRDYAYAHVGIGVASLRIVFGLGKSAQG